MSRPVDPRSPLLARSAAEGAITAPKDANDLTGLIFCALEAADLKPTEETANALLACTASLYVLGGVSQGEFLKLARETYAACLRNRPAAKA